MKRPLLAAAGIAALAVSIALALLGRAVLATPAAVDRAAADWPDRVQVACARPEPRRPCRGVRCSPSTASTHSARSSASTASAVALQAAAGDPRGPVLISRLIPKLRSPEERAQAFVMAGTLLAYSAGAGFGVVLPRQDQAPTEVVLGQARADFRAAVRSDPGNEAAKYDLELLLRQQQAQSTAPAAPPEAEEDPDDAGQAPEDDVANERPGAPRGHLPDRERLLSVTFAHPLAALSALAGIVPIAVALFRLRTGRRVRRGLDLPEPRLLALLARPVALACLFALLGLAAARPTLRLEHERTTRTDVQVVVALDSSRSMLAASAAGPARALAARQGVRAPAAARSCRACRWA